MIMRLLLLLILFIPQLVIAQDKPLWWQRHMALVEQMLTTDNEDDIAEIAKQDIEILYPIYIRYNKDAYNDGLYDNICAYLISAYTLSHQYHKAKDLVQTSIKRIDNADIQLELKNKLIEIHVALGNYNDAEQLMMQITPIVNRHIAEIQYVTDPMARLNKANIISCYCAATYSLQTYFINRSNSLKQDEKYQDVIDILTSHQNLFTDYLTYKTKVIINEIAENASQILAINIPLPLLDTHDDASSFLYRTLADCYSRLGDYTNAEKYFYMAEQYCYNNGYVGLSEIAYGYLQNARHLHKIGNWLRAHQYYSKCINVCTQIADNDLDATKNSAIMELATLVASMGDTKSSYETITILIEDFISKNQVYTQGFLNVLLCAHRIAEYKKDFNECIILSSHAIDIIPRIKNLENSTIYNKMFHNNIASAYIHLKQYERALTIIDTMNPEYYTSNTYLIKGFAEKFLGKYADAIQSWQNSLHIQTENELLDNRMYLWMELIATAIEAKILIETQDIVTEFLSRINQLTSITTLDDQYVLLPEYQTYYKLFLLYYSSFNIHADIAYDLAVRFKGAILRSMADLKSRIYETKNVDLIDKYKELLNLEAKLVYTINETDIESIKSRIYEINRDILITLDLPSYSSISWRDIKASLKKKNIAIEFVNYMDLNKDSKYAALILRKDWDTPKLVELCAKSDIERYKPFDSSSIQSNEKNPYKGYKSKQLYKLIWSKLEPFINEGDDVYFAPDGLLYQMNIEVLHDDNGRRSNEKWNLHRVSSTRELCMGKPKININSATLYGGLIYEMRDEDLIAQSRTYTRGNNVVITRSFTADSTMRVGWKYLGQTKDEIDAIAEMCQAHRIKTDRYVAMAGNEESFKTLSGKRTPIIHLATHGFFFKNEDVEDKKFFEIKNLDKRPNKPDNSLKRSGLILAGGQKAWLGEVIPDNVEDGILLAEEIASMDLTGTDLVVLSACETGLGEITSEGVFGLQRAFKKAGVQTLIMSLWKVDDSATSLFMQTFYKHWLEGKTKHEAFAAAQKTVREKEGYSNPYYWAGFIMLD